MQLSLPVHATWLFLFLFSVKFASSQRARTTNSTIKVYWCSGSDSKELELANDRIRCKGQSRCNLNLSPNTERFVFTALGGNHTNQLAQNFTRLNFTHSSIYPLNFLIIDESNINARDRALYQSQGLITVDNKLKTHAYHAFNSGTVVAFGNEYFRTTSTIELHSELELILFNAATPTRRETEQLAHAFISPLQAVMRMAFYNPSTSWSSLKQATITNYIPNYALLTEAAKLSLQKEYEAANKTFQFFEITTNSKKIIQNTENAVSSLDSNRLAVFKGVLRAAQIYYNSEFTGYMAGEDATKPTMSFLTGNRFVQRWCDVEDTKILEAIAVNLTLDGQFPVEDASCSTKLTRAGIRFNKGPESAYKLCYDLIPSTVSRMQNDIDALFMQTEAYYRLNRGVVSPDLAAYERKALWYQVYQIYIQKLNARFL